MISTGYNKPVGKFGWKMAGILQRNPARIKKAV